MEHDVVSFTLEDDPQIYKLTYDFNAICDAEAVTGCNLLQAQIRLKNLSATEVRGLLYACLKPAYPAVLLSEAGDLLSRDLETVSGALAEALGIVKSENIPDEAPAETALAAG
ncbi:MAG TPA: hypothetical protein VNH18_14675 [Bryobacteraceae bacterium]|nr:hypothetical protein [Blastocatellia bacterium]HXJ40523.1 hypothetical protein [Bryobacteraceae bacterium]